MNPTRLHFAADGTPYWTGRPMTSADFHQVLKVFDSLLAHQLTAWWERKVTGIRHGVLPETGVLAQMAGMEPLHRVLSLMEDHLEPEDFFADRLDSVPEPPAMPKPLFTGFRFAPNTQVGEMERRQAAGLQQHDEQALRHWERRMGEYQRESTSFGPRIEKGRRYPTWRAERKLLDHAINTLRLWSARISEAQDSGNWDFLPPGPDLAYSISWLKPILMRHDPEASYDFGRINQLIRLQPESLRMGTVGGTEGYLAFIFRGNRVALESPRIGNALYLFRENWQSLCQLPKSTLRTMIAEGDRRIARHCHTVSSDVTEWVSHHLLR